jgi:hypothetical protein
MQKNSLVFSIALLLSTPLYPAWVKLESPIISSIDGLSIGITGESIAMIKQFQAAITKILLGERRGNGRVGTYEFEGKKYNVQELRKLEAMHPDDPRFAMLLTQIRGDFETISQPFQAVLYGEGTKTIMGFLIEESCMKRNRLPNSLLYIWAKNTEKDEYELFDIHVKSIKDFEMFLIDLNNFLGDLVFSCPIAYRQFKEQVEKFNKAKEIVTTAAIAREHQQPFLTYLNTALVNVPKQEITKRRIEGFYTQFKGEAAGA